MENAPTLKENNSINQYRSVCFWYSDTEEAGEKLAQAAMEYPPSERENFLTDVFNGARVQIAEESALISKTIQ